MYFPRTGPSSQTIQICQDSRYLETAEEGLNTEEEGLATPKEVEEPGLEPGLPMWK